MPLCHSNNLALLEHNSVYFLTTLTITFEDNFTFRGA